MRQDTLAGHQMITCSSAANRLNSSDQTTDSLTCHNNQAWFTGLLVYVNFGLRSMSQRSGRHQEASGTILQFLPVSYMHHIVPRPPLPRRRGRSEFHTMQIFTSIFILLRLRHLVNRYQNTSLPQKTPSNLIWPSSQPLVPWRSVLKHEAQGLRGHLVE